MIGINFNDNYNNKLYSSIFSTIRLEKKGNVGDIVEIKLDKEAIFKSEIIEITELTFEELMNNRFELVMLDTGIADRVKAINLFRFIYPGISRSDMMYVYILKKI